MHTKWLNVFCFNRREVLIDRLVSDCLNTRAAHSVKSSKGKFLIIFELFYYLGSDTFYTFILVSIPSFLISKVLTFSDKKVSNSPELVQLNFFMHISSRNLNSRYKRVVAASCGLRIILLFIANLLYLNSLFN